MTTLATRPAYVPPDNEKGRQRVFRHRMADVHVGLGSSALSSQFYRGGLHDKPTGGDMGTFFLDELCELALSNQTSDFRDFRDMIGECALTKPLLVHHKDRIARALINSISHSAPSLNAYAKLSYYLCRDLGKDFLQYVPELGTKLFAALLNEKNLLTNDVPTIRTIFLVFAGWYKSLAPDYVDSLPDMKNLLQFLIDQLSHKSNELARLCGETLAIALRKVTDTGILFDLLSLCCGGGGGGGGASAGDAAKPEGDLLASEMQAEKRSVTGLSTLFFECLRGVTGQWHSCFDTLFQAMLRLVSDERQRVAAALVDVTKAACKHATPVSLSDYLNVLLLELDASIRALQTAEGKPASQAAAGKRKQTGEPARAIPSVEAECRAKTACIVACLSAAVTARPTVEKRLLSAESLGRIRSFLEKSGGALAEVSRGDSARLLPAVADLVASLAHFAILTPAAAAVAVALLSSADLTKASLLNLLGRSSLPLLGAAAHAAALRAVEVCCQRALADCAVAEPKRKKSKPAVVASAPASGLAEHADLLLLIHSLFTTFQDPDQAASDVGGFSASLHAAQHSFRIPAESPAAALALAFALQPDLPPPLLFLAWRLTPYLPAPQLRSLAVPAAALAGAAETHPVVAAFALRLLYAVGAPGALAAAVGCLQRHPTSSSVVPSVAEVVRASVEQDKKVAAGLAGDVREACLEGLRSGQAAARLSAGAILRTLELSTLGEESNFAVEMLDAAERSAKLRADDMAENREKVVVLDKIVHIVRHGSPTDAHLELAASILLGVLHVRFRPLWAKAQDGLQAVAERNMALFWPLFVKQLSCYQDPKARTSRGGHRQKRGKPAPKDDDPDSSSGEDQADEADAEDAAESAPEPAAEPEQPAKEDPAELTAAWRAAEAAEASRQSAATAESHFKSLWDLVERLPPATLRAHSEAVFLEYKKQTNPETRTCHLPIPLVAAAFLRVLTRQAAPEELPFAEEYRADLWLSLQADDETLQRLALTGLAKFRENQKVARAEEKVAALIPKKDFKNGLIRLEFETVRSENVQRAVFSVLRPKLWQNRNGTRHTVLNFLSAATDPQLSRAVDQVILPLISAHERFNPTKTQTTKYLTFVHDLVGALGMRLEPWVKTVCANVLIHLKGSYTMLPGQKPSRIHREARRACLRILTKIVRQFGEAGEDSFPEGYFAELAAVLKAPIEDISNAAGSMGALMSFLAAVAESPAMAGLLRELEAVPALIRVLQQKAATADVFCEVMRVLTAAGTAAPSLVKPHVGDFLACLHAVFIASPRFRSNSRAWMAAVTSVDSMSELITAFALLEGDEQHRKLLHKFLTFLLDSLRSRTARLTEKAVDACANVLVSILPKLPAHFSGDVIARLSPLFSTVSNPHARYKLALSLSGVAAAAGGAGDGKSHAFLRAAALLVVETNAVATRDGIELEVKRKREEFSTRLQEEAGAKAEAGSSDESDPDSDGIVVEKEAKSDGRGKKGGYQKGGGRRNTRDSAPAAEYDFDARLSALYKCTDFLANFGKKKDAKPVEPSAPDRDAAMAGARHNKEELTLALAAALEDTVVEDVPPVFFSALAHNLAFFVSDDHQSIRATAGMALASMITASKRCVARQGKTDLFDQVISPVVHQGARFGVQKPDALIRNEWLRLYGACARAYGLTPGLCSANKDFDFYENLTHPQSSRRLKALACFRQHSGGLPEKQIDMIFIPYFLKLLQASSGGTGDKDKDVGHGETWKDWGAPEAAADDDEDDDEDGSGDERGGKRKRNEGMQTQSERGRAQALVSALLQSFAHVAGHLSWGRYHRLVLLLLRQDLSKSGVNVERSVAKCLAQVLDGFHFLPTQREAATVVDDDEDDALAGEASAVEAGKEKPEPVSKQAQRIGDVLVEKIIPAVHKFWRKGDTVNEGGNANVSLARLPLSVAILKLLKFVPPDVEYRHVIDSTLTELVSKLKTKKAPQRDSVRFVLADAIAVLGPSFLGKVLHLLRWTLVHGYQLHVMGYTVVAVLSQISKMQDDENVAVTEHVDSCLDLIVDILMDDYIGVGGAEKEVEELAKTMKEYKKNRSLEGVELACRLATPEVALTALVHRVQKMFTPTDGVKKSFRPEEQRFVDKHKQREAEEKAKAEIDVIDVSTSLELVSKVKTLLRRCARGVTKNKQGSPDALVEFAVETLRDNGDSRDKFLQAFEVKQAGLKVRLTDSSRVEDVAKEREKRKELWVVLDQPTRRDRGFEKREVTSQKRQFGSARTKRVQESKRRIVVPSAAAKVTLQSMDCIDELVMSIAWALVGQMEKDKNPESMAAVADLAEPLIRVIEGEASDSVATLALLVLHELLKATYVTVQPETVAKLGETVFDVVERTGEIRSACFRLLAVLLLHRELALRPELAIVCCSLVRTDLDKKNTFVIPALHLLKAIVVRKIEVPEVYDLMPIVQEKVLHHSASAVVSQLAASVIARFITDWKMTPRKLDSHLDFIIRNLGYPVAAGRLALLGLLRIVFQRFPEELLKKDIEYFFVPLAHRLMADDERPVRRLAALALAALFKLAGSSLSKVVSILDAWLHGDAALQITALQALNVLLKETEAESRAYVDRFFPEILLDLTTPASIDKAPTSAGKRKKVRFDKENWEVPYHATIALESVIAQHSDKVGDHLSVIWNNLLGNLLHSHPWVRTATSRLLTTEIVQRYSPPRGLLVNVARALITQLADLSKTTKPAEEDIESGLGGPLETDVDGKLVALAIKNLTWIVPAMKLPRDRLIVLKEITAAMYPGIEPTIAKFAKMSASRFFATFGTVRPGALVRLAGVLLIKLYSSRRQTTEPPAAQQAENAEGAENGTGAVAEQDAVKKPSGRRSRLLQTAKRLKEVRKAVEEDEQREKQLAGEESLLTASAEEAVFDEVRKLVLFVYACSNIPATGSPLGVVAKEIVDVWKAELTDSRFTRCFHAMADKWRAINQQKSSGTQFKSLSKGRQLVEVNPDKRRRIVPKARQMLPTTDGSTAMPGGRRRSSAAKAPTKKSTQKRKKGGR